MASANFAREGSASGCCGGKLLASLDYHQRPRFLSFREETDSFLGEVPHCYHLSLGELRITTSNCCQNCPVVSAAPRRVPDRLLMAHHAECEEGNNQSPEVF